jgi:hypothetical protein
MRGWLSLLLILGGFLGRRSPLFFGRVGLRARMTDFGTLLLSIGTALFSLAVLSLVLWPALVALLEISKAIRSVVPANKELTSFVLTNTGETIWFAASRNAVSKSPSMGEKRLRFSVLLACGMEAAFIVFLTVFLFQHADPRGDGMEMVGVGFAFMLIFLPFTLPAFVLARNGRWLVLAAFLAALGAFAYFGLWLEMVSELGLPKA